MYAPGRYEVRAKVPKAAGLEWAIWTFWGNEVYSYRRVRMKLSHARVADIVPFSDSPTWLDQSTKLERLLPKPGKQFPNRLFPNHEIDIEIPSSAPQTVCPGIEKYDTMNMNCYRWTNSNGTGTYNNLFCHNKKSPFIGDGKYYMYRFDWHTGSDTGVAPCVGLLF